MRGGGAQDDEGRCERSDTEMGIDRSQESERCHRKREHRQKGGFIGVGNELGDDAGVDGAAERADRIFDRRLQRAADTHLRHDHGGQHRPQSREWGSQELCHDIGKDGSDRHTQGEPQLWLTIAKPNAEPVPHCCDRGHAALS
jgi:hypothetical protein